ncbi:MAG TPA: DUF92 domain-containing protein [Candidatus Elarobacter sp.]|jgi:uncharacterized protein (TIGR00297 family)
MTLRDVVIGAAFAAVIAGLAWRARSLTRSGAFAAFIVGLLTYAGGSVGFALVLLAFFIPAVLLSRLGRGRKRELVDIGKHGARDALQVAANGGVATACAVVWAFTHDPRWAVAFAGAYAAAAADTSGTEIGTLARHRPRSILTLRPVATGLSGGISLPGTLAELAASLWIGAVALAGIPLAYILTTGEFGFSFARSVPSIGMIPVVVLLAVPLGGFAGATVDSLLGATLQELRWCDACGRSCETNPHACGAPTRRVRGVPGFSNDLVNLLATVTGAAVAAGVFSIR